MSQSLLDNHDVLQYLPSPPSPEKVEKAIEQFIKSFQKSVNSLIHLKKHCKNPDEDKAVQRIDQLNEQLHKLQSLSREEKGFFVFREVYIGSSKPGNQKNWEGKEHLEDVRNEIDQLLKAIKRSEQPSLILSCQLWQSG